ncbi:MAG: Peptidase rane alanine aminopeptidase [Verrucomicrobiales bacterium]|nr:Peptidase rane alanine aminopeptidase [Verrucomicrobiales bacterium]
MKAPVLIFSLALLSPVLAESANDCLGNCGKERLMMPLGGEIKPGRKYARDRLVDIRHLALEVTPDFKARSLTGKVTIFFTPIAAELSTLSLDSVDLSIDEVTAAGAKVADRQVTEDQLLVHFAQPVPAGQEVSVTVSYHAQPENGLHFRTTEMGYPAGDDQVWSQGEAENHRFWFPCYDYPNERFSSEVTCRVPAGMEVISNGSLVAKTPEAGGLVSWHWLQKQPHVNYLIALGAGYFSKLESKVGDLPISLFVPPSEKDQAAPAFRDTQAIMTFFQKEIGVPFPWDKYDQVYCHDFLAGGMENTSCSFMAGSMLFPAEVGKLDTVHPLDAHEMAHQWFGDLLTCRDWAHLWLNEGFASYYTLLYEEEKNGRDGFLAALHSSADQVIRSNDRRPIVWRDYGEPMQQFDSRAYPKGAWVLHMLRSQLGKSLYQKAIRLYIERHRNGIVTTDDLQEIMEEVSGRSFDQFFDQWVHHGGVPELKAEYSWDAGLKQARVLIKQTQKTDADVLLFKLPVPVRFVVPGEGGPTVHDFNVTVSIAEEAFQFSLPAQPEMVRLDPELTVLAKWDFNPPQEMLKRQLKSDFESRWKALESFADKKDEASVKLLLEIATTDAHHAIRVEAVEALAKAGTPSARAALISLLGQEDERVRLAAVRGVAALYHPEALAALTGMLEKEKNPIIVSRIVSSFAAWPQQDAMAFLNRGSYHEMIASSAVSALRGQNRRDAVPALLTWLGGPGRALPQREFGQALDSLAFLSRDAAESGVQPFLTNLLTDNREVVRSAAARALGQLRDPRSLAALRNVSAVRNDPAAAAAGEAIGKIEAAMSAPVQTQEAWKKVQDLTQKTEELEKKLEKLENRGKAETEIKK